MGKRKKLYNLRGNISNNAARIKCLLENIIYKSDSELEKNVFSGMALELAEDIKTNSEKIGRILKH
jgi:hypothetical protein